MPKISKAEMADEDKWRAESDARTLSEAMIIKADKKRFEAAIKSAKEMLAEKKKELKTLQTIADEPSMDEYASNWKSNRKK